MAYVLMIAAVDKDKYRSFQQELGKVRKPFFGKPVLPFVEASYCTDITHYYLSAGTGSEELNKAMYALLEEGEPVSAHYWHPYRVPLYHDFSVAESKISWFRKSYQAFMQTLPADEEELYMMDFNGLLKFLDLVTAQKLGILHFLKKPQDTERANKVIYPCICINSRIH